MITAKIEMINYRLFVQGFIDGKQVYGSKGLRGMTYAVKRKDGWLRRVRVMIVKGRMF